MRVAVWPWWRPQPAFQRSVIIRPLAVKAKEREVDLSLARE